MPAGQKRNGSQTWELCDRLCKRQTTIDAQREQSATTRCEMSSGRRSDEKILAIAHTSLGRRQMTPASFCSGDNSSSPSGSLDYQRKWTENQPVRKRYPPLFPFCLFIFSKRNGIYLNKVPVAPRFEEGVVHRGATTPLITDPFCNTRCCSSVY